MELLLRFAKVIVSNAWRMKDNKWVCVYCECGHGKTHNHDCPYLKAEKVINDGKYSGL